MSNFRWKSVLNMIWLTAGGWSDPGACFAFSLRKQASGRLVHGTGDRQTKMFSPVFVNFNWYLLLEIRVLCEKWGEKKLLQFSKPPWLLHCIGGENALSHSLPWCSCSQSLAGWEEEATAEGVMVGHSGYLVWSDYATNPLPPQKNMRDPEKILFCY